ncbi:MAG: OB-fold nucleic acid binding domain-containing protein [Oscillospiraceae bacterium]|nr:OB-fold nucleic acid binding domain-containing protein [Oscillospiraceae bacterium]
MKKILALLLAFVLCVSCLAACTNEPKPTEPSNTTPSNPTDPTEPVDPWASYEITTIADALAMCEQYVDAPSTERYYIRGTVKEVQNDYGQMIVEDATGSIMVYGTYSADGSVRYSQLEKKPVAGDEILLYGTLQNYKGNTKEIQSGWIIDFISKGGSSDEPSDLPADGTELTIAEILALPLTEEPTTQKYTVHATIESITNAQYGAMVITDGTGSISVYNTKNSDGTDYAAMGDKPYKGDKVVLSCTVHAFKGEAEIKQAYIVSFEHVEVDIDPSEYAEMTIAAARDTATGTKVKVSGVVARITYANGMIPSGIILVDGTSSIYVYDGDLAARVAIGNTISIYASKTYWILESESGNASKFGYKGCNQLETAVLISNDEGNTDFDKSWIETTTVKAILDTPVSTDISTKIFKVTAQVKEVPGNGFTNYYINDLDGTTGSYAYSQCNGNDFEWLRAYDGKIVTVYVMALNAKSTSSDCFWRFLPIAVVDEGFDASSVNIPEHVVKYFGVTQFQNKYTGNPAMELLTSVDSELLNFKGAALSYASSNSSVISIDGNVMNCLASGTAEITVTATYNGKTYSEKVTITVEIADQSGDYATVKDAINANVGDVVTVKGVVGPSLVNRTGFYLFNDDAMIAVVVSDAAILESLEIGHEVVLEAKRDLFHNNEGNHAGQIALTDAKVVSNFYGNHEYSTSFFITGKTLADIVALDITEHHSTEVYVVKATVEFVETDYFSTLNITHEGTTLKLYMSGAGQYSWLKAYTGQEVTLEIAPCNWNNKKDQYRGTVLAVVHEDGTKTVNSLNFN